MVKRAAFSLIELVLAIVIIAISIMTIPLMLSQSSNNDSFAVMQESILAARTKMGNILSYQWDDNSTVATATSSDTRIKVVDVIAGDVNLSRSGTILNRRRGHINADDRRRMHDMIINGGNPILPAGQTLALVKTNINNFNTEVITMSATTTPSALDYIRDFNITTNVFYIDDNATYDDQNISFDFDISSRAAVTNVNRSTNIKMIELEVQSAGVAPFTFRAFSSNIGQTELLERTFN